MDNTSNTEIKEETVVPDIRVQKHPKSKKFKKIYYIAFIVLFVAGFFVGTHSNYSGGGTVMNRYSELNGESIPVHENKYTGWYFLTFTYEGEGWQHNSFYDMGYSNDKTIWGDQKETYEENIVIFIILNILLASAPFVFDFIRKKESCNTELNITDDRIYGSSGVIFMKKRYNIPFKEINDISVLHSKSDKLKSGSTLEFLYKDKKATFSYIQNAEDVKNYIKQCVSSFKESKEEAQIKNNNQI